VVRGSSRSSRLTKHLQIMVVQVNDVDCTRIAKYRSMWIAIDTALLEKRAGKNVRMALAEQLLAISTNISAVHVNQVECKGQRLDCFRVLGGRNQFTHNIVTCALAAQGLIAEQFGTLASEVESQLESGLQLLAAREDAEKKPSKTPGSAAAVRSSSSRSKQKQKRGVKRQTAVDSSNNDASSSSADDRVVKGTHAKSSSSSMQKRLKKKSKVAALDSTDSGTADEDDLGTGCSRVKKQRAARGKSAAAAAARSDGDGDGDSESSDEGSNSGNEQRHATASTPAASTPAAAAAAASDSDEPRKRKAHKRQRRPQRAKQQGGRTAAAAAADSDSGGVSDSGNAQQIPTAGTALAAAAVAAATPAPQRTEDVAALQQVQAIATQLGIAASSTDFVIAIKALQDGTAAAQRERAEALATSQIAAESRAELQAAVSAGQKERHDLDVRAGQLSAENADLKAKLSTAEYQLTSSKTALASVGAELKQKSDANAVLSADNTEFEKRAAANAKTAALLSKKLCSALAMLKEALPHEVSSVWSNYSFYCSTMLVHA
jgi:hypothetical protein